MYDQIVATLCEHNTIPSFMAGGKNDITKELSYKDGKPAFYKDFIELCKVGRLVFNEIQGQCHKDITKCRNTKISIERKAAV